jgi:hypothetical protein
MCCYMRCPFLSSPRDSDEDVNGQQASFLLASSVLGNLDPWDQVFHSSRLATQYNLVNVRMKSRPSAIAGVPTMLSPMSFLASKS